MPRGSSRSSPVGAHGAQREARGLALGALFEAEFGQRTALRVLERRLAEEGAAVEAADLARQIVHATVANREQLDALISSVAPQYPVGQLAKIDRSLLRSALGELLHCPTTPARVAIAEWVELARTYSGEPARRLLNGVLGRVASEAADRGLAEPGSGNHMHGGEEDRRTGGSNGDRYDI
jgi:transcription antitermination protein NusB